MASVALFTVIFIVVIVLIFLTLRNGGFIADVLKPSKTNQSDGIPTESNESNNETLVTGGFTPQSLSEYYADFRRQQQAIDPTIKNKTIIRLHYTDWCKFCKLIKPAWIKLRRSIGQTSNNLVLMQTDHDKERVPAITIVPTLVKHKPDGTIDIYNGKKTYSAISEWIHL